MLNWSATVEVCWPPGAPFPHAPSSAQCRGTDESPVGSASQCTEAARRWRGLLAQADARGQWDDGVACESNRRSLCQRGTTAEANGGGLSMARIVTHDGDRGSRIGISSSKKPALSSAAPMLSGPNRTSCPAASITTAAWPLVVPARRSLLVKARMTCAGGDDGMFCWAANVFSLPVLLHSGAAVARCVTAPPPVASRGDFRHGYRRLPAPIGRQPTGLAPSRAGVGISRSEAIRCGPDSAQHVAARIGELRADASVRRSREGPWRVGNAASPSLGGTVPRHRTTGAAVVRRRVHHAPIAVRDRR
jgi:hypothetical protein